MTIRGTFGRRRRTRRNGSQAVDRSAGSVGRDVIITDELVALAGEFVEEGEFHPEVTVADDAGEATDVLLDHEHPSP